MARYNILVQYCTFGNTQKSETRPNYVSIDNFKYFSGRKTTTNICYTKKIKKLGYISLTILANILSSPC